MWGEKEHRKGVFCINLYFLVYLSLCSDLADWLGVEEIGLFNFKPSVRPVPLEVHIQACGFGLSDRAWLNMSVSLSIYYYK